MSSRTRLAAIEINFLQIAMFDRTVKKSVVEWHLICWEFMYNLFVSKDDLSFQLRVIQKTKRHFVIDHARKFISEGTPILLEYKSVTPLLCY